MGAKAEETAVAETVVEKVGAEMVEVMVVVAMEQRSLATTPRVHRHS